MNKFTKSEKMHTSLIIRYMSVCVGVLIVGMIAAWFVFIFIGPGLDLEKNAKQDGRLVAQYTRVALLSYLPNEDRSLYEKGCALGFETATDFFLEVMKQNRSFYAPMCYDDTLKQSESLWGISLGLDAGSSPETPFMFTKNVRFSSNLKTGKGIVILTDMTGLSSDIAPYRDRLCVVVTWGGEIKILLGKEATQENFNPDGATNTVLLP